MEGTIKSVITSVVLVGIVCVIFISYFERVEKHFQTPPYKPPYIHNMNTMYGQYIKAQQAKKASSEYSEIYGNWTIYYNSTQLRETAQLIQKLNYKPKRGDVCVPRIPHVIIVGVAKSGTRELSDLMGLHPNIRIKRRDGRYKISAKTFLQSKSQSQFVEKMPCTFSNQLGSMKQDAFFYTPTMPQAIHAINPKTKIIAIVREPVSRMASQMSFRVIKKVADIQANKRHIISDNGTIKNTSIVKYSNYAECFERYQKYFPRNQILIVETDQFNTQPDIVLEKVRSFLGVPKFDFKKHLVMNDHTGFYCIRIPSMKQEMACYDRTRGRKSVALLSIQEKKILREYFKPRNERFFELIGETFTNWM